MNLPLMAVTHVTAAARPSRHAVYAMTTTRYSEPQTDQRDAVARRTSSARLRALRCSADLHPSSVNIEESSSDLDSRSRRRCRPRRVPRHAAQKGRRSITRAIQASSCSLRSSARRRPDVVDWPFAARPRSHGDVAQLARAPALQAGGRGFESHRLHARYDRTKNGAATPSARMSPRPLRRRSMFELSCSIASVDISPNGTSGTYVLGANAGSERGRRECDMARVRRGLATAYSIDLRDRGDDTFAVARRRGGRAQMNTMPTIVLRRAPYAF